MSEEKSTSLDILGAKPIADSVHAITKGAVEGAGAFLSRICLPAAEEFGLLIRDKVSAWRAKNLVAMIQRAEELLSKDAKLKDSHAHPRLVASVIENGSWADTASVQGLWAGLLTSSCTHDGTDQGNLIFINLLSQISTSEALLFQHLCEVAEKVKSEGGWIGPKSLLNMTISDLQNITGLSEIYRIDLELDHLRTLGLTEGGFNPYATIATVGPSSLGLQMYVRCQGYAGSPLDYFGLT